MRISTIHSTGSRKCVVCNKKTGIYREYGYADGISITIPVCHNCENEVGMYLQPAMDAHLKGIAQSVRMSRLITYDENYIKELQQKADI